MTMWTRREALLAATSATLIPTAATSNDVPNPTFRHGVSSGDPDSTSIVLWTRVSGSTAPVKCAWELADDPEFSRIIRSGTSRASADRDFTVKVIAEGLEPGGTYHYRFRALGDVSPPGRTRTLPVGHLEALGLAIASCSNYPFGFFNAYEAIAEDPDVQFVLHLGDYIYEYGPDGYGGETGNRIGRAHKPAHEIVTLDDYRARHAQYKTDAGSRAMHAAHPLIAVWDDHETTNNPWANGAENHQPEAEGAWQERRDASLKAYFEWMPIRDPSAPHARAKLWRHFEFGDLASLITLETRHTGRSKQIEYAEHLGNLGNATDAEAFMRETVGAPHRNMLSGEGRRFAAEALRESVVANRPWRLVGNQIPMARTHAPPLDHPAFVDLIHDADDPVGQELAYFERLGELDLPIYLDPWDGYPRAREDFYRLCRDAGARDLLVLTGDSHSFWANTLFDDRGARMGLELGTAGISSPGDFLSFGDEGARVMDELLAVHNTEVEWTNCRHNGYLRLVLGRASATADFVGVSTVLSRSYTVKTIHRAQIERRQDQLRYA